MANVKSPRNFYGHKRDESDKTREEQNFKLTSHSIDKLRKMPDNILGPSQLWMEFTKQAEALTEANKRSTDYETFCTFVSQQDDGHRKFIVAHPEVYWWYYNQRPPEKKCSYEVIPEGAPCWLYLDLEFMKELNPRSNGPRMTDTTINIICAYLLKYWGLPCNKTNVVNLDSTSNEKFSRHLIFSVKDVAFKNNFHIGRLIKSISADVITYLEKNQHHDVLSYFNKVNIEELLVETSRGKKLFIDTAVYTKNRHFRIYKSTKWGKQSYLTMSKDSKYIPLNARKDKELAIFLESLISYFPNKKDLLLLEFFNAHTRDVKTFHKDLSQPMSFESQANSSYPKLDKYIQNMVAPGKIRACKYLAATEIIIYEIIGNRYCQNIGRYHKSNHIYWVVDIKKKLMYQKCHDEDCSGFASEPKILPEEVTFYLDEETDNFLSNCAAVIEDAMQLCQPSS